MSAEQDDEKSMSISGCVVGLFEQMKLTLIGGGIEI